MNKIEIAFIVSAALSALFSSTVLVTTIVFPMMRKRVFMQIIIFISVCDIIASVASAFGFPSNSSVLCPAQSFLSICFYKASWMWTTILSYQLYCIMVRGKFGLRSMEMHLICWVLPLCSTLLPLSTTTFGRDDDRELAWCYLRGKSTSELIWIFLTFYDILAACLILMSVFLLQIYWKFRDIDRNTNSDLSSTIDALTLYPIGMLVTWCPNLVVSILANSKLIPISNSFTDIFNAVSILATQNGTIVAVIFFMKSKEARYRWKHLFLSCFHSEQEENDLSMTEELVPVDFEEEDCYLPRDYSEMSSTEFLLAGTPDGLAQVLLDSSHLRSTSALSPILGQPPGGFRRESEPGVETVKTSISSRHASDSGPSELDDEEEAGGWNKYSRTTTLSLVDDDER